MIFRIAGREYTTATTDQLLGHSIGPVAGYGVSRPLKVTQNMIRWIMIFITYMEVPLFFLWLLRVT